LGGNQSTAAGKPKNLKSVVNILVVDDIETNRKLLRATLEAEGHTIFEAADGVAALAALEREQTDAVISDILMPRMDGYRLCHEVRASPRFFATPFLFYTATYTSPADRTFSLQVGADKFLTKPAPLADLLAALKQAAASAAHRQPRPAASGQELVMMKEYNERLVAKLEQKNIELEGRGRLAALSVEAAAALTSGTTLRDILQRCAEAIVNHLDAAFSRIWTLNEKENVLELQASAGLYTHIDGGHARVPVGKFKIGLIAHERKPHLTNSVIGDPRVPEQEWAKREGLVAFAGYPLVVADKIVGVAAMFARQPLPEATLAALGAIADSIALGIERKQAESALLTTHEELQRLVSRLEQTNLKLSLQATALETAADAITITSQQGEVLWVNPAFTRLTGYATEEVVGKNPRVLKSGQHDQEFYRNLWETILAGKTWRGEFTNRRKDGSLYYGEQTITPVRSDAGEITHFVGIMNDVTERRRAEEELRLTHEKLRHLLEHSPAVLYTLKIEGQNPLPVVVSDNVRRLLGFTVAESASYEWWFEHLHPDDRDRVLAVIAESMKGEGYSIEYRVRHKNGTYRWVEDNNRVVRDPAGQPAQSVGVWTDITERKRAEEQIREQARLLDLAQDAIIVCDLEDRVQFWNASAERLYGWKAAEAVGRQIRELIYPKTTAFEQAKCLLLDRGGWSGELEQVTKDKRRVLASSRWTLVRDAQGLPKSVLVINTDITERKNLETRILRSQRLESIGQLAAGVAHDLNNIIAPILMSGPMLRLGLPPAEFEQTVNRIEKSAQRGAQVIKQLMTLGRGSEGRRGVVQLRHLIKEMLKIMEETFPKSIRVEPGVPRDLWTLTADVTQLHQVLLNLCVNARDAMPQGGKLTLKAENLRLDQPSAQNPEAKAGPYVLVQVMDTGTGIPAGVIERIFEPFFTTKEPGKGTGLGLATVLGIVRGHNGFIEVESEPGQGSKFKVYLPATPEVVVPDAVETLKAQPKGRGEVILVVDDEALLRETLRTILGNAAYQVLTANDGIEAVAAFSKHQNIIKAVVCNLMMPVMDGVGVVRILKRIDPKLNIITSTGLPDDPAQSEKITELRALGVRTFLTKPYAADELLTALHEMLQEN
jgi:PAS domain S-box-containing protein